MQSDPLKEVFDAFDADASGLISVDELAAALNKGGKKVSHEEALAILKQIDTDKDGAVSYSEFVAIFSLAPDALPMGVKQVVDVSQSMLDGLSSAATGAVALAKNLSGSLSDSATGAVALAKNLSGSLGGSLTSLIAGGPDDGPLPAEATKFVGEWKQASVENYDLFLKECVGLSWATRKIAAGIKPRPTWTIEGNELCVKVEMLGAAPVFERYGAAEREFDEADANQKNVSWHIKTYWEDATVLCSVKTSPKQNGGRPITARRYLTPEGALIVTQEWAAGKVFTQKLVRV